jgi:hypothetical protein
MRRRVVVTLAVLAGFAVFCVVQDRVTAEAARRYVALQREAVARQGPLIAVDTIMKPAIARSVREGLFWGGAVLAAGLVAAAVLGHR